MHSAALFAGFGSTEKEKENKQRGQEKSVVKASNTKMAV